MRRLQYDAPSQAVRNLITNPELVADVSDKLLYKNAVTNPSFETAGSTFDLWVNNMYNPAFRSATGAAEIRRNLALNPSMEATTGTPEVRRNHVTHPSFELTSGTSTLRTNICTNPGMEDSGSSVVVRSNLSINPAFEASSGTVNVRANYCNNASLAVNATGWTTYGGSPTHPNLVTSRSAASWSSSGYAWKVEGTANSLPYMAELGIGDFTLGAGVPITVSISVIASASRRARIRLRWAGSGGDSWSPDFWLNSKAPTRMSFTATAPAGATGVSFNVKEGSGTADPFLAGDWIAGSMALVEVNSTVVGPYFDGATPSDVRRNLVTEARATTFTVNQNALGWRNTRWWGGGSGAGTYSLITGASDGPLPELTTYARKTWTVSGTTNGDTGFDHGYGDTRALPIAPNTTYTASSYLRATGVNKTGGNIAMHWYDASGAFIVASYAPSTVSLPSGQWVRLTTTATSPTNAAFLLLISDCDSGTLWAPGEYLDGTGLLLEQSSSVGTFFDGSTPASGSLTPSWLGTANASQSVVRDADFTYSWGATAYASISYEQAPKLSGVDNNISGNGGTTSRVYQTLAGKNGKGAKITKTGGHVYFDMVLSNLTSGSTYIVSYDVLTDQSTIRLVDRGVTGASIYAPYSKTVTPGVWTRVSQTITVGAADTSRNISVAGWEHANVPDGSSAIVDNLLIEAGSTVLPYFDGSTPAAEGLTYAWTGTANASWSNQVGVHVINRTGLSANAVAWQSTKRSRSGTKSAAFLTKKDVPTNSTLWYPAADYVIGSGAGQVPANTKVTWSVYVWVPSGAGSVRLMEAASGAQGNPNTLYDQWERLTLSLTTPAGNPFNLRLRAAGTVNPGYTIWVDDELLEVSDSALPYFDGNNPAQQNLVSNPSFTTNVTGYTGMGATLTRVTNQGGDGAVCELTQSIGGASREGVIYIHGSQLPAGSYTVSFDYKGTDASFTNVRTMLYDQATANVVSQSPSPTTPLIKDGNFNRYTHTLVASAPFDRIYIEVLGTSIPLGAKLWLDRVLVERSESAVGQYYEGTGDITTAWTGTANASTSTMTAPNVAGWATGVSGLHRSTLDPKIGSYSAALMTKGNNGDGLWPGTDMDAIAGRTYTYSAWIKATSTHGLTAAFRWKDSGFVSLGDTNVSVTTQLTVGAWSLVSATATAPANTAKVQMMLRIYETHTPTTFYVDGAIFVESHTAVPYFDGSTAASGDFTYAWIGAAHASASAQLGVGVSELPTTGSVAAISSTDWKGLGSRSLRLISLVTTSADTFTHLSGDTGAMRLGMVAGKTYTISGTCRITAPQTGTMSARARRLVLFHRSPGEQNYTEVQSTQAPNVAGQARVFLTFTIPSTVTECFIRAYHGGQAGSADVWWDDILVEETAILRPYFDGSRPAVENLAKSAALAQYVATHTTGVSYAGSTWTRITTPAGTSQSLTRQYVDLNFLRQGETYTTAVTVANDSAASVTVYLDWADIANTTFVIAPGEQRRIMTKGVRATGYDNTYRFADLHVQQVSTESKSILFKDWIIELGDTAGDYYSGTREFTYAWTGVANTSPSTESAPVATGCLANKSSGAGFENSQFKTYQSIDENGKKIGRWLTPAGTPNSSWRIAGINNTSFNYGAIISGETYTFIMKYRSSGWSPTARLYISMRNPDSSNQVMSQEDVALNTGWTTYRRTFTASMNGLASSIVYLSLPTIPQATTDGIFDLAEVALVKGTYTGDYFDGNSTPTSNDFSVVWSGTPDASTSKVVATSVDGTPGDYSGRMTWQSNNGPVAGKKSVAVLAGRPNVDTFVQTPHPFAGETLGGRTFTVLATRKTTESYIASGADGRAWRPHWVVNKSGGGTQAYQPSTVESTAAGIYKFRWTFTFASDITTTAFFRLYNGSPTAGNVVYWDDLAIIEGAYPGEYFDGDTTDTASNTYLWDGAAHASASSMRGMNVKGGFFSTRANIYSSADTPFSGSHKVKGSVAALGYFPRMVSNAVTVVPGRRYTAFAKMKCSTQPVQIALSWNLASGGMTSPISQAASNGSWTKVSTSVIAPDDAVSVNVNLGVPDNSPLGTEFEIDSLLLTNRAYDGPFGSGSSYGWEWEGTPHESASKGYPVGLMQLAGKPLFVGTLTGQSVLTDIDPDKNPVIPAGAPRTIYTIVENLQVVPTGQIPSVWVYGIDSLNDTVPNTTIIMRQQSQSGNLTNTVMARRTGGAGANTLNVPPTGKQILIAGMDANGVLFSAVNKSELTVDSNVPMSVPHERINISPDSAYHKHIATYIYPGVHSSAVRAEMVKLLADHHNIPGLG